MIRRRSCVYWIQIGGRYPGETFEIEGRLHFRCYKCREEFEVEPRHDDECPDSMALHCTICETCFRHLNELEVDDNPSSRATPVNQNWLAEYEALQDRPPTPGALIVAGYQYTDGVRRQVEVFTFEGVEAGTFRGAIGAEIALDPRRNALLFVKAWEAANV